MQTYKVLLSQRVKVSICIASHNMGHLLQEAIESCEMQDYKNIEIVVLDDASTDNTSELPVFKYPYVKYFRSESPSGTGGAFNKAILNSTGDIIVLLCADDVFTDQRVISDIVEEFCDVSVGHVSRYYYQFVDGDRRPVRAWHNDDIIELANNPTGLAFRRLAIEGCELSNKMFVEASSLVSCVLNKKWNYRILRWDTVAVRIHKSISRTPGYYKKMWKTSPVEEWAKVGGSKLLTDYTSLIQIKNNFTTEAVVKEIGNFIKLRPLNLLIPSFWFFSIVSLITPRPILYKIPEIYRSTIGKWTTKEIMRT